MFFKLYGYYSSIKLCEDIRAGKRIDVNAKNSATAPLFLDGISSFLQVEMVEIPLVEACLYRNIQAVEILLDNGADPNFSTNGNLTPLEAAIHNGPAGLINEASLEICKKLVVAGCDVNKHSYRETVLRRLAQQIEIRNPQTEAIATEVFLYLLPYGIDEMDENEFSIMYDSILNSNNEMAIEGLTGYTRTQKKA